MLKITKEKVYDEVGDDLLLPIGIFVWTMMYLFLDSAGVVTLDPMLLFTLPILAALIYLPIDAPVHIQKALGIYMPTLRSKVVILVSIPISIIVGYLLALMGAANSSIFPTAIFPFNVASTSMVNPGSLTFIMASIGGGTVAIVLNFLVSVGEEGSKVFIMKHVANKAYPLISSIGVILLIAWAVAIGEWSLMHWFAYKGLSNIGSYIVLMFLGTVWAFLGIGFGILAYGNSKVFSKGPGPAMLLYCTIPPIVSHLAFNYFLPIVRAASILPQIIV